tara:strand:+ start:15398 stop:16765 length:1368 start_codon:yes stop_codon:yes gene_type:complete
LTLESALLKQILSLGDFDTWNGLKQHYLPEGEYRKIWNIVDKHVNKYKNLPTFEELKLEVRSAELQEKIYAIETVETDVEADLLLDYLKNQFTQSEILGSIETYIDKQIAISDARENIDLLQEIVVSVEDRVDTQDANESMETIELFDDDETYKKRISLGLNQDFDLEYSFKSDELIMLGATSGGGKSLVCCNIASTVRKQGRSALYFTIEMNSKDILQRIVAIETEVNANRLIHQNLEPHEWNKVGEWWAGRFVDGDEVLAKYDNLEKANFKEFHKELVRNKIDYSKPQIEIYYDPALTTAKISSVVRQNLQKLHNPGVIIIDYLNQVKRSNNQKAGQYDWTEQIEISKYFKTLAQEYDTTTVTAIQTKADGSAKFSTNVDNAVDAFYSIDHFDQSDCMKFSCKKRRNAKVAGFCSEMDWDTLKVGPHTALDPDEKAEIKETMGTNEKVEDMPW